MHTHVVHFWLKPDLSDEQVASFVDGLKSLKDSPNVQEVRVGTPITSARPVVDSSFSYQLLVTFEDSAAHDRYQSSDDPAHEAFIAGFKSFWTKVLIYDALSV